MRDEHPSVRGIRRIMEFDKDPRALTLSRGFIDGVNLLEKFGWSFDINPNHTQMDIIREFVPRISSGVPMILDHCGKPGIKQGAIEQYREDVKDLARYPNMCIKLSDLPPYAGPNWTEADLRPYIDATLETFGPERTIYAGDYPILLQATNMTQWVEILDRAFADLGLSESETRAIYRDNAVKFYRLDREGLELARIPHPTNSPRSSISRWSATLATMTRRGFPTAPAGSHWPFGHLAYAVGAARASCNSGGIKMLAFDDSFRR